MQKKETIDPTLETAKMFLEFLGDCKYKKAFPESIDLHRKQAIGRFIIPQTKEINDEFNGVVVINNIGKYPLSPVKLHYMLKLSEQKFHESWDWLMRVLDKIENILNYRISMFGFKDNGIIRHVCYIYGNQKTFKASSTESKLKAVYDACEKFVKSTKDESI